MLAWIALLPLAMTPPPQSDPLLQYVDPYVRLHRSPVPASHNGWWLLSNLPTPHSDPALFQVPAGTLTRPQAADILRRIQPLNASLDRAASTSILAWQEPFRDPSLDFPVSAKIKSYVKLLMVRGRARFANGQNRSGAADLVAALGISRSAERGAASLVSWLSGYAAEAIVNSAAIRIVAQPGFTGADAAQLLAAMPASHPGDGGMQDALRCELQGTTLSYLRQALANPKIVLSEESPQLARLAAEQKSLFDVPDTVRQFSRGYGLVMHNIELPWGLQKSVEPLIQEMTSGWPKDSGREPSPRERDLMIAKLKKLKNPGGRQIVVIMIPVLDQSVVAAFKGRAEHELARTILALKVWSSRNGGRYPQSLTQLVSAGILKAPPMDAFSGRPIRYDLRRMLVWSVGQNGRDDNGTGRPGSASTKEPDIVWPADGRLK